MTDRDTFAAAALTGLLANEGEGPSLSCTCRYAYRIADAMLRERAGNQREMECPQPTLTDEEREAVKLAADFLEDEFYGCSDKCAAEHSAVATLRKLLERTK